MRIDAVPWTLMAAVAYVASITLGTLSLRCRRVPRAWHTGLFLVTLALTLLAAGLSFPAHWARGLLLLVALVPIALLPFVTVPVARHRRRHALVGLAASPWYLAAVVLWALSTLPPARTWP